MGERGKKSQIKMMCRKCRGKAIPLETYVAQRVLGGYGFQIP
jgi:hypothetical protein